MIPNLVMTRKLFFVSALMALLLSCTSANQPLADVVVAPAIISPNADGKDDLARISYRVKVRTPVSIYLTDAAGQRYTLRNEEERAPGPSFEYLFNGIAEGHMLPNGDYTWHIDAGAQKTSGPLKITDADAIFPKIAEFTLDRTLFTPNRDGIDDRIAINVFTTKVGALSLYVVGDDNVRYEVLPKEGTRKAREDGLFEPGRYDFDFDGGIDLGADPPPDGNYTVVAQLQDAIGQQDVLTRSIVIKDSGRPVAEIVIQPNGSGVAWSGVYERPEVTLPLGGTLFFTTTVKNVGLIPIRTAGPFNADDCYKMGQSRYTKGFEEEAGAWRVGIDFEGNRGEDHPWRWGVGSVSDLDVVSNADGAKLYYLPKDKQVVVRGCITFDQMPQRNPFVIWGALIHEGVDVVNARVTPIQIKIAQP